MKARSRTIVALASALALGGGALIASACDANESRDRETADGGDAPPEAGSSDAGSSPDVADASDGNALVDASPEPVACSVAPCAVEIAAGAHSACVRLQSGAVQCWGSNEQGELGRGAGQTGPSGAPAPVADLEGAVQISGAASDTGDVYCALRAGGSAVCWGANSRGTLGRVVDGSVSTESSPVAAPVEGLGAATAVFAGVTVSCATLAGSGVTCWGSNTAAQLPTLPREPFPPAPPTTFALGVAAVGVGIGDRGTVALTASADLVSWGIRGDLLGPGTGVLGREVSTDLAPPAKIMLAHVSAVAASFGHACAIANGRVVCWGAAQNTEGDSVYPAPTGVGNRRAFAQTLSVGPRSVCATLSDGTARCWGDNARGQLGAGTTVLEPLPVKVTGLAGRPVRIAAMRATTCAVLVSGAVQCWGQNDRGQLGTGTADALAHLEPQNVVLSQ